MQLIDTRFVFQEDNPFGFKESVLQSKLRQILRESPEKFRSVNPWNRSRFAGSIGDVKVFRRTLDEHDITSNPIMSYIQSYCMEVMPADSPFSKWCSSASNTSTVSSTTIMNEPNEDTEEEMYTPEQVIKHTSFNDETYAIPTSATILNVLYDITTDNQITYDDLRMIVIQAARRTLINSMKQDEVLNSLELERRSRLMDEISRYRAVKGIASFDDSDISSFTTQKLEEYLLHLKSIHEAFKRVEVGRRILSVGGLACDTLFPDGIPLGKNRKMKLHGIGNELMSQLFDTTKTVGLSMDNTLRKRGMIGVKDEVLVTIVAITEILKGITIETVDSNTEKHEVIDDMDPTGEIHQL